MSDTFSKPSLCLEAATRVLRAAEAKAAQLGLCIATTVVDESGVTKAFARMDGAPLVAVDVSRKKATTAVGFGLATGKTWHDFVKDDPILAAGAQSLPDFTMLGGGFPIIVGGHMVGAVGVSGGHYSQDEECARAGLGVVAEPGENAHGE